MAIIITNNKTGYQNIGKSFLKDVVVGGEVIITQDNYNMSTAPAGTRYFLYSTIAEGSFHWYTKLPDPGKSSELWRRAEITIMNTTFTGNPLTLDVYTHDGSRRILLPNQTMKAVFFQIGPGGAVKLYSSLVEKCDGSHKWCWEVTQASVPVGS